MLNVMIPLKAFDEYLQIVFKWAAGSSICDIQGREGQFWPAVFTAPALTAQSPESPDRSLWSHPGSLSLLGAGVCTVWVSTAGHQAMPACVRHNPEPVLGLLPPHRHGA